MSELRSSPSELSKAVSRLFSNPFTRESAQKVDEVTCSVRKLALTQPLPPLEFWISIQRSPPALDTGPVRFTPDAVGWSVLAMAFSTPAPVRMLSTSPGITNTTAYG